MCHFKGSCNKEKVSSPVSWLKIIEKKFPACLVCLAWESNNFFFIGLSIANMRRVLAVTIHAALLEQEVKVSVTYKRYYMI